jgi:hypothetical protein
VHRGYLSITMNKIITTSLVAAAMLAGSSVFAGDKACCAKGAANAHSMASLNLTADQKAKIEAWQAECMKAGCTKQSRETFLTHAKGILSGEQFAQLKAQCKNMGASKKSA